MKTRRNILIALGVGLGAFVAPVSAFAQQKGHVRRIGFLGAISATAYAGQLEGFRAGLRDFGYVEGRNIAIEYRWAEGKYERLPELAAELVRSGVELIVTHGSPAARAAKQATTTVPIVIATIGDVLAQGIVTSLARPGGNITGSSFFSPELSAKRVELLKEAFPHIRQLAILWNPDNKAPSVPAMEAAAKSLKIGVQRFAVRDPGELESAFTAMSKSRMDAVAVMEDAMFVANTGRIAALATKERLVAAGHREFAEAGGPMGYGVNFPEMFRRAAYFVDRIIKGAKPGDLPFEQPTKFELVINLKTVKALGMKLPQSILVRADRVIE